MDLIKEAFQKVKQDMDLLYEEINYLRYNFEELKQEIFNLSEEIKANNVIKPLEYTSTQIPYFPTTSTHPSTHNYPLEALKGKNMLISTGNEGVPTDRQTDRQTDKNSDFLPQNQDYWGNKTFQDNNNNNNNNKKDEFKTPEIDKENETNKKNSIDNAMEILNSLDNIKKEIRLKFKRLTEQEFLVFSTLYNFDEELGYSDYKMLANKLNLTESSIRDYIGRLIKKGIPVEKNKINNKSIKLSISSNLKKIATLPTILQLRGL